MSRLNQDVSKRYPRLNARASPKSASSSALPSEMQRKLRQYPALGVNGAGQDELSRTTGPRRKQLKVNVNDSLDYPMGLTWNDGTPVHASSLLRFPASPALGTPRSPKRGSHRPAASPPLTVQSEVARSRAGPPPAAPDLGLEKRYERAKHVHLSPSSVFKKRNPTSPPPCIISSFFYAHTTWGPGANLCILYYLDAFLRDDHFFTPSDRIGRNYTPTARGLTVRELGGGGYLGPADGGGSRFPKPMAPLRKGEVEEKQRREQALQAHARSPLARGGRGRGPAIGFLGGGLGSPMRSPQVRRRPASEFILERSPPSFL